MTYAETKAWRMRNPDKRNADTLRNYRTSVDAAFDTGKHWTSKHDDAVLAHTVCDRELGKTIGRSVKAIHIRRARLKGCAG